MALIALVISTGLVACGGGDEDKALSKGDYKKQAQTIGDKFEADFEQSLKNATSKDPQESLTGVKQITTSAQEAHDGLDKLDAPKEYKGVHDKLVTSLQTLVDRGNKVEEAVDAKDQAAAKTAVTDFQQGIQEVNTAGQEFDKKVGTT